MAKIYTWTEEINDQYYECNCLEVNSYELFLIREALKRYAETVTQFKNIYSVMELVKDIDKYTLVNKNPINTDNGETTNALRWKSEYTCDSCGCEIPNVEKIVCDTILIDSKNWKYCPNCGERLE